MKKFRISASAIIIDNNKILLAKYKNKHDINFFVGPGGGIKIEEGFEQGLKREVYEETRLKVNASKMLLVEDLLALKYRVIKIWFLCNITGGNLTQQTPEALEEGIIDIGWYTKDQLKNEIVYPSIIQDFDWENFSNSSWQTQYFEMKKANF